MAQKDNFLIALKVRKDKLNLLIVNFEASDYMTRDTTIFQNYKPCYGNFTVWIADGSLSKVVDIRSIVISKNLTLESILLVLNLDYNLLCINKLTQYKNNVANFS